MKKTSRNDITGDWIQSKPNSEMFEKNFDAIFRKKKEPMPHEEFVKSMLENEEVYKALAEFNKEWDQMKPVGKEALAEYELDKSTGEVIKKECNECKCGVKGCD
jgi:chromosome segregation ATPase